MLIKQLLWWEQVVCYSVSEPKFVFVGFLQFPTLTSRCHLHHNQLMTSSLMDILFSALVAVLRRVRPKEIEKPKAGHYCVLLNTGLMKSILPVH